MARLLALGLLLGTVSACATSMHEQTGRCFHADAEFEIEVGYCQAVRSGDLLFISGNVGKGEMRSAIRTAYDDVKAALTAHGLTFGNVVKETVFTTDIEALKANRDVRKEYYKGDFPAATWVQIQRLYSPAAVIEVEVTAQIAHR